MADGTGAAAGPAAAAPAVPALSSSARLRNKQASDYMHQLKLHFSLAARNLSPEQRLQRHEQVVRAAFAGCPGAPDPALWAVRVRGQQALGAQASYSYRHTGGFAQGRKFNNLVTVARELANAHAAELARAPGPEDDSQLPTSPVAAVSEADASSGTRVLARVHQTVSEDGAARAQPICLLPAAACCLPTCLLAAICLLLRLPAQPTRASAFLNNAPCRRARSLRRKAGHA